MHIALYIILAIIGWEYLALRIHKILGKEIYKPTGIIDQLTFYSKKFWYKLGFAFVKLSSFYIYLGLEDLFVAIWQLSIGCFNLCGSWHQFLIAYLTVLGKNAPCKSKLIILGSLSLILISSWFLYTYRFVNLNN